MSRATVSFIFPYTADIDFVLFSTVKILTHPTSAEELVNTYICP